MRKLLIYIFLLSSLAVYAQQENFEFTFIPSGLNILPLKANMQEARIGILYFPDNANLKVDIGNSIDLLGFSWKEEKAQLTFGIDFTAYALSTSFQGHRLQIDALDGFFGGNASFSKMFDKNLLQLRLRIIHNSAHMVDGHYDLIKNEWMDNTNPIPFTRDFGELTLGHVITSSNLVLRYYGGTSYSTLIRPDFLKKWLFFTGFELSSDKIIGNVFSKPANLFLAYQIDLRGLPVYAGNNNFIGGIKFGSWLEKGIVLYVNYYTGNNYFSEYYYRKVEKFGVGFFIDFF